jgi:hypothetical protein
VNEGRATVETILTGCVSMFNATNLTEIGLGEAVESAEGKPPILTFRASAEYKAQVNSILDRTEFEVPSVAASKSAKLELVPKLEESIRQAKQKKAVASEKPGRANVGRKAAA